MPGRSGHAGSFQRHCPDRVTTSVREDGRPCAIAWLAWLGVPVDVPRLEHVRVNVSDFDRAVAWYESILELRAKGHWPPNAPKYAHFQTGPTQFALSVADPVPAAGRYNFSVTDVDQWWAKLRDRADVVEPLRYAVRHSQVHHQGPGRQRTRVRTRGLTARDVGARHWIRRVLREPRR